ncbi:MAG: TonB-dependent receptor [Pseudomonadota bacterium]
MKHNKRTAPWLLLSSLVCAAPVVAQEDDTDAPEDSSVEEPQIASPIDEVVAVGRLLSTGQALALERMDDAAVTDFLGADQISRTGDSSVAVALKRVPGLSLVNNQFVYIRGLGERYSQSTLNGAFIPSPDLTRNVIPLDIFPVAIVDSLRVQKAYTPDMSANFAGGSVDVRTKGIPDGFTAFWEIGTGFNTAVNGNVNTYAGGSEDTLGTDDGIRALTPQLLSQLARFQGNTDTQGLLLDILQSENPGATVADAELVNRQLALELNRNLTIESEDPLPDVDFKGSIGNSFFLNDDWEFGFLAGATYAHNWREEETLTRNFNFPEQINGSEIESTRNVNISGILNFGLNYGEEHSLSTNSLYLRNTDDETVVTDFFNENRLAGDGLGFRNYRFLFEERTMRVNQLIGEHRFGAETRDRFSGLGFLWNIIPEDTKIDWFFSDSTSQTDIPNQVDIQGQTVTDTVTNAVLSESIINARNAAVFRYTGLEDEVESSQIAFTVPFETDKSRIDFKFGFGTDRKARTYEQYQFGLGTDNTDNLDTLTGDLGDVYSDSSILNPDNEFFFDVLGTDNQSYIAATITDASFGMIDWTFDETWRFAVGARYEAYSQVAVDWNPLGFSETSPQVTTDPVALERASFQSDDVYPSVQVTYMGDWLAETFQLRFGYSQTAVRPDLREITDASYIDPITGEIVDGNPGVIPATVDSFDARAEWFFADGDNATITLFYKDIADPIEFFESAASDTNTAREIINADSAELLGVELEGIKQLGFLGPAFDGFFVQGNLTIQDTELVAGPDADAPTNPTRELTAASDYVANITLGYDSADGRHTATLVYNVFGERLYVAGRNGAPDGFEQPFNGLDATYSWFPTDRLVVKAKAQNILGEEITIEREGVTTFIQDPGSAFAVSVQWTY